MDFMDSRAKFFPLVGFGILYGTALIAATSNFFVVLEDTFFNKINCEVELNGTALNTTETDFCDSFTKWRDCSIVGIFVGVLILVSSLGTMYVRYRKNDYEAFYDDADEETENRGLVLLIIAVGVGVVMIMAVFGVLIDSQAHLLELVVAPRFHSSAIAAVSVLGFAVALPCIGVVGVFIFLPFIRCLGDIRDWCN